MYTCFCQFCECVRYFKRTIRQESSSCTGKKDHRSVKWNCFYIISVSVFQHSGYQESVVSAVTNGMVGLLTGTFRFIKTETDMLSWLQISIGGIRGSNYQYINSVLVWCYLYSHMPCLQHFLDLYMNLISVTNDLWEETPRLSYIFSTGVSNSNSILRPVRFGFPSFVSLII